MKSQVKFRRATKVKRRTLKIKSDDEYCFIFVINNIIKINFNRSSFL